MDEIIWYYKDIQWRDEKKFYQVQVQEFFELFGQGFIICKNFISGRGV